MLVRPSTNAPSNALLKYSLCRQRMNRCAGTSISPIVIFISANFGLLNILQTNLALVARLRALLTEKLCYPSLQRSPRIARTVSIISVIRRNPQAFDAFTFSTGGSIDSRTGSTVFSSARGGDSGVGIVQKNLACSALCLALSHADCCRRLSRCFAKAGCVGYG